MSGYSEKGFSFALLLCFFAVLLRCFVVALTLYAYLYLIVLLDPPPKSPPAQNIYDDELSGYDEEDDMGMGVSNTVKNRKPAKPKPEEVSDLHHTAFDTANYPRVISIWRSFFFTTRLSIIYIIYRVVSKVGCHPKKPPR